MRNGDAIFFYANGDREVGKYKNYSWDGTVTVYYANGIVKTNNYVNGILTLWLWNNLNNEYWYWS